MMNRNQFLSKLAAELSSLPKEEIEAAMEFYTEFLDDVGKENEEEAIKSLGDPKKIASQIKADYAVRQMDEETEEKPYSPKRGLSAVKWTLLGIFSAPIVAPLAIVSGCVAIALLIAFLAIIVSAGICVVALGICAVVLIVVGIMSISVSVPAALLLAGVGLAALGMTVLALSGVFAAARAIFRKTVMSMNKTSEKRRKRRIEKEKARLMAEGGADSEQ